MKLKYIISFSLIIISAFCFFNKSTAEFSIQSIPSDNIQIDKNYMPQSVLKINYNHNNTLDNINEQNIKVVQPIPLSYKSKQEIYNIRKNAVKKSIFNYDNYEPSEEVFGQIQDNKPWISMNSCLSIDNKKSSITGNSEEARFILNPSALVQINFPFSNWCEPDQTKLHLHLKDIKYQKDKNEIIVTYEKLNQETLSNNSYFTFCGINARDLGYKYAFIDLEKSTYNLQFVNTYNISTNITEFQDFLHTGGSCGHESGCNNASPSQPMLDFENSHKQNAPYEYNKEIYIKLWKNKPLSPSDKPDIVERIIIEKA